MCQTLSQNLVANRYGLLVHAVVNAIVKNEVGSCCLSGLLQTTSPQPEAFVVRCQMCVSKLVPEWIAVPSRMNEALRRVRGVK
jgi:hypothetical protein